MCNRLSKVLVYLAYPFIHPLPVTPEAANLFKLCPGDQQRGCNIKQFGALTNGKVASCSYYSYGSTDDQPPTSTVSQLCTNSLYGLLWAA